MVNYLQNGTRTIVIAVVLPEIHAFEGDDKRAVHFEKTLIECLLPGKNCKSPYTVRGPLCIVIIPFKRTPQCMWRVCVYVCTCVCVCVCESMCGVNADRVRSESDGLF